MASHDPVGVTRPDSMSHVSTGTDALSAATLLGDDLGAFEAALDASDLGPVAVVGRPFGGRETVLDAAERRLGARRIELGPGSDPRAAVEAVGSGPLVVSDCQHLFARDIGGFDALEAFLGALAGAESTVVTGWNSYAWSYLSAVEDIEAVFPTALTLAGLPADRLVELARRTVDPLPTFRRDDPEESLLAARRYAVRGRTVRVPVPDRAAIEARRADRPSPTEAVFERLAAVSGGTPGVALALLDRCRHDGEIRPSDVGAPEGDAPPGRQAAFCLRVVLASERVRREHLVERLGERVEWFLARFARAGVLVRAGDVVRLDPAGVPAAAAITDRERIL